MISINSLPPEVTEVIIRQTAASGDEYSNSHFKNQLTLTARISPTWTYPSQMIMHSDLRFIDGIRAKKWLECGIAGKFKTKRLILGGSMQKKNVEQVMKKVMGLEKIFLTLHGGAFDMKLLQGERFSDLSSFVACSEVSYKGNNLKPFKFRLSELGIHENCNCSPVLLSALLASCQNTVETLILISEGLITFAESILELQDFPRIKSLCLDAGFISSLAPLRELEFFHAFSNDKLDHLEFILSTILPGQLKEFKIELDSDGELEEEDLESVERMMKLPGLNRLERITVKCKGSVLDQIRDLRIEWESRGIAVAYLRDFEYSLSDIESD